MTGLAHMIEATAEICRDADVPADSHDQDAVVVAAMRLGYEVLGLAQRILVAQHDHDPSACRYCDAAPSAKHPPGNPAPKPPPPPPPPDKGGK